MNRSRLAALSAGAMFLVASVFVPAVATADTGNTNTIKVLNAPTYNPPVSSGTFTVNVVANGSVAISGAGAGLTFDNTKLQLTNIAKDATQVANGVAYAGFPSSANLASFLSSANAAGSMPVIAWSFTDGVSSDPANADQGIFTATFNIIASGNSTIGIVTGTSGGILGGVAGNYGASLPVTPVNGVVTNSFAPIWSLSAPASASVLNGATATATLTTTVTQGAPGAISFAVTGLPANVTAAAPSVTGVGTQTSTLTFNAAAAAVPGTTTVTVTATDSQGTPVSHSQNISLTVVGNNDFSVGVSPSSGSVNGGGAASGAFTVNVATLTGTPGAVTLTTSALPAGLTAAFAPSNVVTSPGTSALTFLATTAVPSGNQTITISATNGIYTHTTTLSLNVIQTPAGGQNVNVNGTLDSGFLGLTCPSSLAIPLLRGNTNQLNVPCQVYTNTVWNLNVNDPATDAYKGHMVTGRPVDNTTTFAMADSMHVLSGLVFQNGNPAYTTNVDLAGGGTVLTGTNSASAPLVLSQFVRASTHPGTYGIQVVFSAVSVF